MALNIWLSRTGRPIFCNGSPESIRVESVLGEKQIAPVLASYKSLKNEKTPEFLRVLFTTFVDQVIVNNDDIKIILKVSIGLNGAEDRNWTGTEITLRGILSPLRLPVPPPRHKI